MLLFKNYWFHGQTYKGDYSPDEVTYEYYNIPVYFLSTDFTYSALQYAVEHDYSDNFGKVIEYQQIKPIKVFSIYDKDDLEFAKENGFSSKSTIYDDEMERWKDRFINFIFSKTDYDGLYHNEMEDTYNAESIGIRPEIINKIFNRVVDYNSKDECLTRPEYKKLHDNAIKALKDETNIILKKDLDNENLTKNILTTLEGSWTFDHYNENYKKGFHTLNFSDIYLFLKNNIKNADWNYIDSELERNKEIEESYND